MKFFLVALVALLILTYAPGGTEKCWNLLGKCRQKCLGKEKFFVYCLNNKLCCVKDKNMPRDRPWLH
ncbi:beta-defensin 123-like [Sorex araneus]|uniref:beta-defensin 123-like n=1 Tax=Sorex araneus TaxID=42254 RepID=UPI000331448F|nr:beta-defensin 123-like [Sorex araneus]